MAISVYRAGRSDFYLLKELDPEDCVWTDHRWQLGDSVFLRRDEGDRVLVEGQIRTRLAGSGTEVIGELRVEGPLRRGIGEPGALRNAAHSWEPITLGAARGSLELTCGDYHRVVQGRAYHDRNGGRAPLHEAGLRSWRWGRFALPDREIVFTTVQGEGEDLVLEVDAQGRATRHPVHAVRERAWTKGWFGPAWPRIIELDTPLGTLEVEQRGMVDDAPFYQRAVARARLGRHTGPGIAERVMVDRLDLGWMRPFVRMRVDRGADSSMWQPLFGGPRRGWSGRRTQETT